MGEWRNELSNGVMEQEKRSLGIEPCFMDMEIVCGTIARNHIRCLEMCLG
jgi:hypothetical protein